VGGVVGGVAALAILAVGLWFLLRKKKEPTPPLAAASNQPPAPGGGNPGAPVYTDPNYGNQPPQPQMAQQQPQGQYGYPNSGLAQAGMVPAGAYDPRNSIAKPWDQQNVNVQAYDPNQPHPQQQFGSPPGSPAPAYPGGYNTQAGAGSPPPGGYGTGPGNAGVGYGQHQGYQDQGQGQQGPGGGYAQSPPQGHQTQFISELPANRGDGELRELA
jgi:hypothetical protein